MPRGSLKTLFIYDCVCDIPLSSNGKDDSTDRDRTNLEKLELGETFKLTSSSMLENHSKSTHH